VKGKYAAVGLLGASTVVGGAAVGVKQCALDCEQLKADVVSACESGLKGEACAEAQQAYVKACSPSPVTSITVPPTAPPPVDPSPVCVPNQICGCWHRPPTEEWQKLPDCEGPTTTTTTTLAPDPGCPRADGAEVVVTKHRTDSAIFSLQPTLAFKAIKPKCWEAAFGLPYFYADAKPGANSIDGPIQEDGFTALWNGAWTKPGSVLIARSCVAGIEIVMDAKAPAKVRHISGKAIHPCAAASPTPPPQPGKIAWKDTNEPPPDRCPEGGADPFAAEVGSVLEETFGPRGGTWGGDEAGLCSHLAPAFDRKGLKTALYGEECALARDSLRSANYDFLATGGAIRRLGSYPQGAYRSTCFPATRSAVIEPDVGWPSAPVGGSWPQVVNVIRVKVHSPAAERRDGLALIDSAGLWSCRGLAECQCGDPPFRRDLIPSCGCEAKEDDQFEKARIVACAAKLAEDIGLRWEGGKDHGSNPWLHLAKPGERVRACTATGVCSDWITGR